MDLEKIQPSGYIERKFEPAEMGETRYHGTVNHGLSTTKDLINFGEVPTFISTCPYCNSPNVWGTTGVVVNFIDCKICKKSFGIKM